MRCGNYGDGARFRHAIPRTDRLENQSPFGICGNRQSRARGIGRGPRAFMQSQSFIYFIQCVASCRSRSLENQQAISGVEIKFTQPFAPGSNEHRNRIRTGIPDG